MFYSRLADGERKNCWRLDGGGADPNMFCARTPKIAERRVKTLLGDSMGRARSGVPMDLSTPDVFA